MSARGTTNLLSKATAITATLFMVLALTLNILSTPGSNTIPTSSNNSILDRNKLEKIDDSFEIPVGKETIKDAEKDSL